MTPPTLRATSPLRGEERAGLEVALPLRIAIVRRVGILRLWLASLNLNRALWMNSHHRDRQPGRDHGFDGPGHVLLPEWGGCAGHRPRMAGARVHAEIPLQYAADIPAVVPVSVH